MSRVTPNQKKCIAVICANQCTLSTCRHSGIEIHHMNGNKEESAYGNLIPLCRGHHSEAQTALELLKASGNTMTIPLTPDKLKLARCLLARQFLENLPYLTKWQPDEETETKTIEYSDEEHELKKICEVWIDDR